MSTTKQKTIGYIRVSTADQDLEKFEADILRFANDKNLGQVEFVTEKVSGAKSWKNRKLADVVNDLQEGDILIVPELSRLGRSVIEVLEVLTILKDKKVHVHTIKEGFRHDSDDIPAKIMNTMLALFAEVEKDMISLRTKEGLQAARAKGKQLGRPKGPGKSRLDPHREDIITLLKNGSTKVFIAERFGVKPATLINWLQQNKLNIKPQPKTQKS